LETRGQRIAQRQVLTINNTPGKNTRRENEAAKTFCKAIDLVESENKETRKGRKNKQEKIVASRTKKTREKSRKADQLVTKVKRR
jgi:hypothetical protein